MNISCCLVKLLFHIPGFGMMVLLIASFYV